MDDRTRAALERLTRLLREESREVSRLRLLVEELESRVLAVEAHDCPCETTRPARMPGVS